MLFSDLSKAILSAPPPARGATRVSFCTTPVTPPSFSVPCQSRPRPFRPRVSLVPIFLRSLATSTVLKRLASKQGGTSGGHHSEWKCQQK